MEGFYPWVVFIHVLGAFGFAVSHGVSAAVALLVLLAGGITAAFIAGLWGRGWIWAAIVTLVFAMGFMYARASRYYGELRGSAGLVNYQRRDAPIATDAAEMTRLLASPRAMELAAVGTLALIVILWLMFFKPF
jgi:hypothetical protein